MWIRREAVGGCFRSSSPTEGKGKGEDRKFSTPYRVHIASYCCRETFLGFAISSSVPVPLRGSARNMLIGGLQTRGSHSRSPFGKHHADPKSPPRIGDD